MGWHKDAPIDGSCFFLDVMDYNYLVFLYFGTIITPALLLAAFYAHIYRVVLKQVRQIVTMNPENGTATSGSTSGGTMLRMLGAAQRNEVKATQNLAIIVLFFMICWIPLYTINCFIAFFRGFQVNSNFMFSCIILSHLNSAGNPLLYAYHLKDFRLALKNFFLNLFDHKRYCAQQRSQYNNNYSNFHWQMRKRSNDIKNNDIKKLRLMEEKEIARSIVKNSAAVAVATTGETNREIWNIQEQPESNSSSNISLKQNDKLLMIRPATPYRTKINQGFLDDSYFDESDDVFIEDTLPFHGYSFDDCDFETDLTEKISSNVQVLPNVQRTKLSMSSPQLSRNLFFVEDSGRKEDRSLGIVLEENRLSPKKYKLSPFKVVNHIFKNNRTLSRSLSDEGTVSMESLTVKTGNGVIVRSSCGS